MSDRSVSTRCLLSAALLLPAALPGAAAPGKKAPAKRPASPAAKSQPKPAAAAPRTPADPLAAVLKGAVSLEIAPASATLEGPRATQHLIVWAALKDGSQYDVTDRVTFAVSNPKVAQVRDAQVRPVDDGQARVTARLGALVSPPADMAVKHAKAAASTEFVNDIMPILAKAGCNSTACHGSPVGKGGFKLSLFGYEPELDHAALAKDAGGKRIDLKSPEKSLVLQKATGATAHGGGRRFAPNGPEFKSFVSWIREGANGLGEFEARVKTVRVLPDQPWIPRPGVKQRLAVTAYMSDGSTQDVTDRVLFSSNDDAVAAVDDAGLVTAKRPGETAVMVRYLGQVAVSRIAVLPTVKPPTTARVEKFNYIDELVQAKLAKLRMLPSDLCTDEEFIRRASLDTCGIIPTPEEVRAFLADRSSDKRQKLVDRLLDRPEFVDLWTMKWNDTLRNNPRVTRKGVGAYSAWIHEQIEKNRPYNELVHDLLVSKGRTVDGELTTADLPPAQRDRPGAQGLLRQANAQPFDAAANYYAVSKDPLDVTSATSQVFLGVRIECARCHNHPFEKWTQNDYYGLAGFFAGLQVRGNAQLTAIVGVNDRAPGVRHPKTNEVVEPKTLDDADLKIERGADKREILAGWITSPENPYFAKAIANRIWGHYFGRGIVEPIDDFRVTNPASNPELLDALGKEVVDHKFDLKALHRAILNSRTYQQSSRPNPYNQADTSNFARFYPKRLMAEQLFDSISQATEVFLLGPAGGGRPRPGAMALLGGGLGQRYGGMAPGADTKRVMQLPALPLRGPGGGGGGAEVSAFMDAFGKPRREVVCECERSSDGNIGQALTLMNSDLINQKVAAPFGRVARLLRQNVPAQAAVEELYLASLSRRPTAVETNEALDLLRSAKSPVEGLQDLLWALLNSREFLFNH